MKRVVPDASFGPCNLAGIGAPQGPHTGAGAGASAGSNGDGDGGSDGMFASTSTSTNDAVNSLMATRLYAAGAPVDFIAMSEYSRAFPGAPKGARQPAPQAMKSGITRLSEIGRLATTGSLTGELSIPVEVHEYGWAAWLGFRGGPRWPHGSFGAAYNIVSWLWQRQAGAARVFTWGYKFDDSLAVANASASGATAAHVGRPIISGWGWTLGAMELLLGTDGDTIGAEMVVDTIPPGFDSDSDFKNFKHYKHSRAGSKLGGAATFNRTFGAFRMAQPKARTLHYLLTAFSGNFTDHSSVGVRILIGADDFPSAKPFWDLHNRSAVSIVQRVFNRTTCAHDTIQADMDAAGGFSAGLLTEDLPAVGMIRSMCTAKGLALAAKSTDKYLAMSDVSLQPRPFTGGVEVDTHGMVIILPKMEQPSLMLLSFAAI